MTLYAMNYSPPNARRAMLNNRRLRVTNQNSLKGALIGTGFPFKTDKHLDAYLGMFRALTTDCAGIRRAGAAALDLAYVAAVDWMVFGR